MCISVRVYLCVYVCASLRSMPVCVCVYMSVCGYIHMPVCVHVRVPTSKQETISILEGSSICAAPAAG